MRLLVPLPLVIRFAPAVIARAEYAVGMEPGRVAVRHAAWDASQACAASFPAELGGPWT